MYDVISIGSIAIDLFFRGDSFTKKEDRFTLAIGGKYNANFFKECLGGGGANVAAGCATHGLSVGVLGKVGLGQFKQIIIQKLLQKFVSIEFLQYDVDYTNISSILISDTGERTIINYQTPNEVFNLSDNIKRNMVSTKFVYMGNLPDISIPERISILQLFKKNNVKLVLNLGVADCRRDFSEIKPMLDLADMLIINTNEYSEIIKKKKDEIDFKNKDISKKINFESKTLVLTDGPKGSYLYSNKKFYHQIAHEPTKRVDTTGAGDAFCAGFISSLVKDSSLELAMESGSKYSAKILEIVGGQ